MNADLARLKASVDLVAVAQSRGVKLTKQGRDYVGLCPFHQEKTPSFHITPSKNLFHCLGCDAGGSVIDFIMRLDSLDKSQAVAWLKEKSGVRVQAKARADLRAGKTIAAAGRRGAVAAGGCLLQQDLSQRPEGTGLLDRAQALRSGVVRRVPSRLQQRDVAQGAAQVGRNYPGLESLGRVERSRPGTLSRLCHRADF